MARHRRVLIIAKQRPFDAEQWQQLLIAFAYVLHEERRQKEATHAESQPPTKEQP